ncbi:MAG: dockerin type I repeat-containing protein [Bacteroidetes bacterium]|nr:dockerin type I repeat-containing protein [Bacteroidota bacterium]
MKKLTLIMLLFCVLASNAKAQVFYVDTILACPPTEIWVPVKVLNFNNIVTLSNRLLYNSTSLTYKGYTLNPALSQGFAFINNSPPVNDTGSISFAWYTINPVSVPDSQDIVTYMFRYNMGSSYLMWDTAGMGAGTTVFINGAVLPDMPPFTLQPDNMSVVDGNMAVLYAGTLAPVNFPRQWQTSSDGGLSWTDLTNTPPYSGINTDILTLDSVFLSLDNQLYRLRITGCDTIYSQAALLTVISVDFFSGTLSYLNNSATPLVNSTINLVQGGTILYSVNPDNFGYFEIPNILPGTYDINIQCYVPWGGNNATDALVVLKHFLGMITLNGLPLQASDIDLSGFVNSTDALLILKRFVGLTNQYPAGNWLFDATSITIPAGGASLDIRGLCVGDVNQSYIP